MGVPPDHPRDGCPFKYWHLYGDLGIPHFRGHHYVFFHPRALQKFWFAKARCAFFIILCPSICSHGRNLNFSSWAARGCCPQGSVLCRDTVRWSLQGWNIMNHLNLEVFPTYPENHLRCCCFLLASYMNWTGLQTSKNEFGTRCEPRSRESNTRKYPYIFFGQKSAQNHTLIMSILWVPITKAKYLPRHGRKKWQNDPDPKTDV